MPRAEKVISRACQAAAPGRPGPPEADKRYWAWASFKSTQKEYFLGPAGPADGEPS